MVLAALGILVVRKAVHAALLLAVVMIGLAVLYPVQDAPFLFAVQIIVYTGAILDAVPVRGDAGRRRRLRLRGRDDQGTARPRDRPACCSGSLLVLGVAQVSVGAITGLAAANADGNVRGPGAPGVLEYVFAFEATSALLITAASAPWCSPTASASSPKPTQADSLRQRICATMPSTASTSDRCPAPASSPAATRSTLRRCSPTVSGGVPRCRACSRTRHRPAPPPTLADDVEEMVAPCAPTARSAPARPVSEPPPPRTTAWVRGRSRDPS